MIDAKLFGRVRSDVEPETGCAELGVLDRVGRRDHVLRVAAEALRDHDVGREHDFDPELLAFAM